MALRRRLKRGTGPDLVVIQQPGGVLVAGKPGAVESAVDRLVEIVGMGARPASANAADLAASMHQCHLGALTASSAQCARMKTYRRQVTRVREKVGHHRPCFL